MRVIAGEFRSRLLKSLPGTDVRPTPDRLREALFNVLAPRIEGTMFVDAYAGTGAVGIEALSRGAARAVFLERSRHAAAVIRENLKALGIEDRAEIVLGRASQVLTHYADADIVFLDPPYRLDGEYEAAMETLGTAPPPLTVVQHDIRTKLQDEYGALKVSRTLRQGDNVLSFYVPDMA
jgi:16S rRNA (guanine(966)-N(2))-methyltransferase RsmD